MNQAEKYGWNANETYSTSYLQKSLRKILEGSHYERLADIGTGNGGNLKFLMEYSDTVVGYEPDEEGVNIARKKNPEMTIHKIGVYDEPESFTEEAFDCAISLEVAEHLFDPHALPKFARQILKPRGKLIVSTPFHGYWKNLALAVRGKWDFHHHPLREGGHIKFFSFNTMADLLSQNGFKVESLHGSGRIAPFWCSMIVVAIKI